MMNKGLELIEAGHLFPIGLDRLDDRRPPAIGDPQSMVEYIDRSTLAQLGSPDMRIPIAHALAWPAAHGQGRASGLILPALADSIYGVPDVVRFPALSWPVTQWGRRSGALPAMLNAANESCSRCVS
jgi:1-deoxy-D-xylulose-5-phosphate reductoisomerase